MPTNFPTSVDNFTNPTANDSLNLPSHSTQHANANDAIEAIETYMPAILLNSTTITTTNTVTLDNIFTSTYRNYKIVITGTGLVSSGALNLQLRAGGVTTAGTAYSAAILGLISQGSAANLTATSAAFWQTNFVVNNLGIFANEITLFNPQLATQTLMNSQSATSQGTAQSYSFVGGGMTTVTTAFDGFILTQAGGNFSGVCRVYGLRD
jgi:hypothetical protein